MEYERCNFCRGEIKEEIVSVDRRWKGKLYIVENVTAGVCQQCGEQYFSAEVVENMEKILSEASSLRKELVEVKDFMKVAS